MKLGIMTAAAVILAMTSMASAYERSDDWFGRGHDRDWHHDHSWRFREDIEHRWDRPHRERGDWYSWYIWRQWHPHRDY
jgi:hypothetical protein